MAITNPCPNADAHQIEPNIRAAAVTPAIFTSKRHLSALQVHEGFRTAILEMFDNPTTFLTRVFNLQLDNDEEAFLRAWAAAQ